MVWSDHDKENEDSCSKQCSAAKSLEKVGVAPLNCIQRLRASRRVRIASLNSVQQLRALRRARIAPPNSIRRLRALMKMWDVE